eukprot:CAMPEP_0170835210 /NCGR_PEP_ID=MMETSP0734-20130129/1420_1 /TAXON_ID=186038 /ORGANISM="Fragilariopsis kerguelensis, Strain L26-C5" /LENGTH=364 /DNA_ID=CAMNT_0011201931 /DNA_START=96 /DNA_END=1187 /DNA_ORIENTATION=-
MDDQGKLKVYRGSLKATPTTTATAVTTSSATNAVAVALPATVLGGGMYEEKRTHGSLMTFNNNDNAGGIGTYNHNHTHYTTNTRVSHNSNTPRNMIETRGELVVEPNTGTRMSILEMDVVPEQQPLDHLYPPPAPTRNNNNNEDTYMEEKTAELLSKYVTWVAFGCWVPCLLLTIITFYILSSHNVGYNGRDVAVQNYGVVVIHGLLTCVFVRKMTRTFRRDVTHTASTADFVCCYPQFNKEDPAANRDEYEAQKEAEAIALSHPILNYYLRILSLMWCVVFIGCFLGVLVPTVQFMQGEEGTGNIQYYENSNNATYIAQLVCMGTQLLVVMFLTCGFLPYYNTPNGRGMTKVVERYKTEIQEW